MEWILVVYISCASQFAIVLLLSAVIRAQTNSRLPFGPSRGKICIHSSLDAFLCLCILCEGGATP